MPREALNGLFIFRIIGSVLLALAIALRLDLSSPGSAAVTVAIISLPQSGMLLEKSFYRFVGTLLGAVITLILVACLAQQEVAFILAVALWIGVCTAASARFPGFRAYGWCLCGYTTALIGVPAFLDADHAFDIAVDRVTIVSVGILSAAVVNALLNPNRSTRVLEGTIQRSVAELVRLRELIGDGAPSTEVNVGLDGLSQRLVELESALSSGVFEDPVTLMRSRRISTLVGHLMTARGRLAALHSQSQPIKKLLQTQADEEISNVLKLYDSIDARDGPEQTFARSTITVDPVVALIYGARATVTALLCMTFWIMTEWPDGLFAVIFAVVGCALLAATPRPIHAARQMLIGSAVGAIAAAVCYLYVLPGAHDFLTLSLSLTPFLAFGAWQMTRPSLVLQGNTFLLVFLTGLNITGVMHYDAISMFNSLLAIVVGLAAAMASLAVLSPAQPDWRARRIVRRLLRTLTLAQNGDMEHLRWRFHHEVHDLTTQLVAVRHTNAQSARDETFASSILEVGDSLIQLRHGLLSAEMQQRMNEAVTAVQSADVAAIDRLDGALASLREEGAMILRAALQSVRSSYAA